YVVEPDPAVVDPVEAELVAGVGDAYARRGLAVDPDRDDDRVHSVLLAADLELGEDDRELAVAGGVADVLLARGVVGGGDDELAGPGVVAGDGLDVGDVGAVAGLGHREAAHQATRGQVG